MRPDRDRAPPSQSPPGGRRGTRCLRRAPRSAGARGAGSRAPLQAATEGDSEGWTWAKRCWLALPGFSRFLHVPCTTSKAPAEAAAGRALLPAVGCRRGRRGAGRAEGLFPFPFFGIIQVRREEPVPGLSCTRDRAHTARGRGNVKVARVSAPPECSPSHLPARPCLGMGQSHLRKKKRKKKTSSTPFC